MNRLDIFSEPFASTGNISAEGFRNLLGRPASDVLTTVIREAFQNSLDAARTGIPSRIVLRVRTLSEPQREVLADQIFGKLPIDGVSRKLMSGSLSGQVRVMEICDFGTTGLGGPTSADAPMDNADQMDFVNFMRNVGAARDVHHGGGTYGYGKTSLYALSNCSTILVDSETTVGNRPVRRMMGCHLGGAFDAPGTDGVRRRHTGRHWWGIDGDNGGVDPIENDACRQLVGDLGFPERDQGETGTSIMIVDPNLKVDADSAIEDEILETVMWNFWPRMTSKTPQLRKLDFRLEIEGKSIMIPRPEEYPPLDLFATALNSVRTRDGEMREIRSQRPAKLLGGLSIQRGLRADRIGSAVSKDSIIPQQSSHIALMRPVELVVRYVVGEAYPDRRYEWAGVFMCSEEDEVEQAFASTEPPAHDDWIPDILPRGHAKTWVNVAMRELNSISRTHAAPGGGSAGDGDRGPSLAATAAQMGRILDRATPSGPGKSARKGGGSIRKSLAVTQPRFIRLERNDKGHNVAIFNATLTNDGSHKGLKVVAEPHLVMDGGAAGSEDLPEDYKVLVSSLEISGKELRSDNNELNVGCEGGDIEITVRMTDLAAVGVRIRLEEGDTS